MAFSWYNLNAMLQNVLPSIDHSVFFFFNHTLANPVFDAVVRVLIRIPGQLAIVLIGVIGLFAGTKYIKRTALILLSAVAVAKFAYGSIKLVVKRPRPFLVLDNVRLLLGTHKGYSFPSGHATISFCLATVIAMCYPKVRYPIFIAAVLVAISRPYVGVHYPSDILTGSLLGIFIGYVVTRTANKVMET